MPPNPVAATRPAAVAGLFYPGERAALTSELTKLLDGARRGQTHPRTAPKALIAPHAGYVYSGPIAANAYALLEPVRDTIRRVVLLGPTHRVAVRGLALPRATRFATPLGVVEIDTGAIERLKTLPQVGASDEVHALEHSREVHVPFLQTVLSNFKLVPLAVGQASPEAVAQVIEALWGGPETLIVVSSDLSHYLDYTTAQGIDRATCKAILDLRTDVNHDQACGATPVAGLTLTARRKGLKPELIDLRNSGDTAGDKGRVVGYASFAFYEDGATTAKHEPGTVSGELLLKLARATIAQGVGKPATALEEPAWLREPGACFVTLRQGERLRGCIGSLEARRALGEDVRANAHAAAFRDPRFRPLTAEEFDRTTVEVSLLSPLSPLVVASEAEALAQLRRGIDGVVFQYGHHRSTYLPQVWEELKEPLEFLATLKQKAGLPPDFWDPDVKLARYTVTKWSERPDQ